MTDDARVERMRAALKNLLRDLPELWGDCMRDGQMRLTVYDADVDAALAALADVASNVAGPNECPTCACTDPTHHPAVQEGGEVQLCENAWHQPTAAEIRAREAAGACRHEWVNMYGGGQRCARCKVVTGVPPVVSRPSPWRPVSDAPPNNVEVLVMTAQGNYCVADCCKGHLWNMPTDRQDETPTHWMPIPAHVAGNADERKAFEDWYEAAPMSIATDMDHAWDGWRARAALDTPPKMGDPDTARLDAIEQHQMTLERDGEGERRWWCNGAHGLTVREAIDGGISIAAAECAPKEREHG